MEEVVERFIVSVSCARILSVEYFLFDRQTKYFEVDRSTCTIVLIWIKIAIVTFVMYLSFPSLQELDTVSLFERCEMICIEVVSIALFLSVYKCQDHQVYTYKAISDVDISLSMLNIRPTNNFFKYLSGWLNFSLGCFWVSIALVFGSSLAYNVLDLLTIWVMTVFVAAFYKTLSFAVVFVIIGNRFSMINDYLMLICKLQNMEEFGVSQTPAYPKREEAIKSQGSFLPMKNLSDLNRIR